jgi:hypothetical protein
MTGSPQDLSMQLGELKGAMTGLREGIGDIKDELRRHSQARHDLAQTVQVMVGRLEELTRQMGTVQRDVTPLTDLRNKGVGMLAAGSAVVAVVGYVFGPDLRTAVQRIFH